MGGKIKFINAWWMIPLLTVVSLAAASNDLRLVDAVEKRDKAAVRSLLRQHVDVNTSQADGATALAWAAHWDDLETADLLIRAGANVNAANDLGVTPLSLACTNGNAAMAEKLLKAGANANAVQPSGETALMTCARTGSLEAVKSLLAHEAGVNAKETRRGQTALMWAIVKKHPEVTRALIERGADVHVRSKGGFTPLLFAAQQGDVESARLLLAAGVNVNEGTPQDGSALVVASASGQEAFAIFLLDNGADPNAVDAFGITALHYAMLKGLSLLDGVSFQDTSVSFLFRPNMPGLVKALLAHGANPNARIVKDPRLPVARKIPVTAVGATPFLLATATYDASLMRLLAANGADPLLTEQENNTPLIIAAGLAQGLGLLPARTEEDERNSLEAVKLAVELGANVHAIDKIGETALHAAAYVGANAIIQFLADKGADVNVKDIYGQTPLSIAEKIVLPTLLCDNLRPYWLFKSTADLLRKLGALPVTIPAAPRLDGVAVNPN